MQKKRLFQYAVLFHRKNEEGEVVETEIVKELTVVLAKTETELMFNVTRQIPENYSSNPDDIEIIIRDF